MRKIIKENKLLFFQLKSGYSKFIPNITPKLEGISEFRFGYAQVIYNVMLDIKIEVMKNEN